MSALTETTSPSFGRAARAAGILTAGRQIGAVVLTVGVLVLPRFVAAPTLNPFLWAYFGELLLSSVLNLGLERYTAREVAGDESPARILGAALRGRLATAVLTPLALALFFASVNVHLPAGAWVAVSAWTLAVQFEGVFFAALRAADRATIEAGLALVGRVVQTIALVAVAASGSGVTGLLGVVAAAEVAVALAAAYAGLRIVGVELGAALPYRKLAVYTALELSVYAYLRADLIVVGRILGSTDGATYGFGYRLIDALAALATPALLVLFAYASGQAARGEGLADTRRRAQMLLPALGVVLAAACIGGLGILVDVLPRLGDAAATLRLLVATVPMTYWIGVEAHLLSAEDRNRRVVVTGVVALALNIALNVVLVSRYGMIGAGVALIATEAVQMIGLSVRHPAALRGARKVALLVAMLVAASLCINAHVVWVGAIALAGAVVLALALMRSEALA